MDSQARENAVVDDGAVPLYDRSWRSSIKKHEKGTIYASPKGIPLNPKDPCDSEMDSDESLTPKNSYKQPPDADTVFGFQVTMQEMTIYFICQ